MMKPFQNFKCILVLLLVAAFSQPLLAQTTKADIFDKNKPVTWLGVDYQLCTYIGEANNNGVAFSPWTVVKKTEGGIVGNDEFRDSYLLQWNQLFIDEQKKYDIAKALKRPSVNYAIDVCIAANKKL